MSGTLNHTWASTGVSCLSQGHWLFFILILLTLVCEITLALNSFLHQWGPWNAHSGMLRVPKDPSLPLGEGESGLEGAGLKTRVALCHLQQLPAPWSGQQGSLHFPGSLHCSGLWSHEPGAAVMPLVPVSCSRAQLQPGVAGLGTPLWLKRTGRAFSSPRGPLAAGRSCRRDLQAVLGVRTIRVV